MKRLVIVLITLLLWCGTSFAEGQTEPAEAEQILVSMATDVGGLGDKSFNDGAWAGLQRGQEEFGVEIRLVESHQQTDYIPNLSGLAEDGAKLVFGVGFLMTDALVEVAANYPDAYFAGIDIYVDPETAPDNALGIQFKEQESGYLAGVVAGLMTSKHASRSLKLNDKNVIGMVLGMDIPPVERYQAGFYAGVMSVNPTCDVRSIVTGSFEDTSKGKEAALALIEQGADIVFPIAGTTGLGTIEAAKEKGVVAIGVDIDQYATAPDTVMTSAEKKIAEAAFLVIKDVVEGTFEGGQTVVLGLTEGATGIAPFHDFESVVPQEVKDAVKKAADDIKAGRITVPAARAEAGYER